MTAKQILNGSVEPPSAAEPLYRALNWRFGGSSGTSSVYGNSGMSYGTESTYSEAPPSGFLSQLQGNSGGMAGTGARASGNLDASQSTAVAPLKSNLVMGAS